jgi:CheY-like chemotaxis protein
VQAVKFKHLPYLDLLTFMTNTGNRVIALMQDLMFMVRIQEAAKRAGLETKVVKTKADLLRIAAEHPALIIIDLNYDAGEPLAAIRELKADTTTSTIHLLAYVSHVQTDLRAAASANGCDTVLARSAFVQTLPEILRRFTAAA